MPDDDRKLFARWSEPCQVVKQVTDTSYAVNMDGRQIVKHVNCLRPFSPRTLSAAVVTADGETDTQLDDSKLPLIDWQTAGDKQGVTS